MTTISTKQKVVDAASNLFFQYGFHGTSVRDIADSASVNVSLISYYFKSKQGLLEYAVTDYYEHYLTAIGTALKANESHDKKQQLKQVIQTIIQYKTDYFRLTSFIHRELSLDSTFVREMTVTYLAKENHVLSTLFYQILGNEIKKQRPYLYLQFKGMLMAPFLIKNEWNNQLHDQVAIDNFVQNYVSSINSWLDFLRE